MPNSLRARFIVGMSAMLLPLVALVVGGLGSLQSATGAFDDLVEEALYER